MGTAAQYEDRLRRGVGGSLDRGQALSAALELSQRLSQRTAMTKIVKSRKVAPAVPKAFRRVARSLDGIARDRKQERGTRNEALQLLRVLQRSQAQQGAAGPQPVDARAVEKAARFVEAYGGSMERMRQPQPGMDLKQGPSLAEQLKMLEATCSELAGHVERLADVFGVPAPAPSGDQLSGGPGLGGVLTSVHARVNHSRAVLERVLSRIT